VSDSKASKSPTKLEEAAALHVILFIVGVSWAFGGNADWVRTPVSIWGSLALLVTIAAYAYKDSRLAFPRGTLAWLIPAACLNALVLISCLSPGFRDMAYGTSHYLMPMKVPWWTPSSARPALSLGALWLFDGIYLSCFNLMLVVTSRSIIRIILAAAVGNALVLSVFGTVQKLSGATGIYFGAIRSPQDYFFASFVYDNHWASFVLLMLAACLGLIIRYVRGSERGGFLRGPALFGIVAAFLVSITVPLSGARFCTLLLAVLLLAAVVKGIPTIYGLLRISNMPRTAANLLLVAAGSIALIAGWLIVGQFFAGRAAKAGDQIREMWTQGRIGTRSVLYHDTWKMALDRPLFGWGMGTYPSVFPLYNSQYGNFVDRIPVVYHDAHSDWLQSFAELGIVGTTLIGIAVALPALSLRNRRLSPLPYFLLLGCALVAIYAWVEFPFGNVAVVLTWWLCFSCAVQYTRLSAVSGGTASPR
jgi:O-antigen ligase